MRLKFFLVLVSCAPRAAVEPPSTSPPRADPPTASVAPAPSRPPRARADWVGVIGTGQSLSVGAGAPALTTEQPFHNLKAKNDNGEWSLVPLVEPIRHYPKSGDGQYPGNILGETPHSAMANQLTSLAMAAGDSDYVTVHSVVGWSGHCMSDIDKRGPGRAYPASLEEVCQIKKLADASGKTFAVGAIVLTHGECDSRNPQYESELHRLWQDYDSDVRAITGQADSPVLVLSQQSTFPFDGSVSEGTIAQWSAGVRYPDHVICAGPKYQYPYVADRIHMDAPSYRRLGEKYAEVLDQVLRRGRSWAPLQPEKATRDGRVVTVRFHVPNPPLAWDETLAPPHQGAFIEWSLGRGFEVTNDRGALAISRADIDGDDVRLTLRDAASGPLTIRYATTQDARVPAGGDVLGRRGQLRDSDPMIGWDAETLACRVEHGSNVVTAIAPATFEARTLRDVVVAPGLQADTIVREKFGNDTVTLSAPWDGASGEAELQFHHDQRNYAVAFRITVP